MYNILITFQLLTLCITSYITLIYYRIIPVILYYINTFCKFYEIPYYVNII